MEVVKRWHFLKQCIRLFSGTCTEMAQWSLFRSHWAHCYTIKLRVCLLVICGGHPDSSYLVCELLSISSVILSHGRFVFSPEYCDIFFTKQSDLVTVTVMFCNLMEIALENHKFCLFCLVYRRKIGSSRKDRIWCAVWDVAWSFWEDEELDGEDHETDRNCADS